jgi:hypothetical protein
MLLQHIDVIDIATHYAPKETTAQPRFSVHAGQLHLHTQNTAEDLQASCTTPLTAMQDNCGAEHVSLGLLKFGVQIK